VPRREGGHCNLHDLSLDERRCQPDRCQEVWYRHFGKFVCGDVLDVGAGSGYGMDILRESGATVTGIDPLPLREDITSEQIESFSAYSFDFVAAMDVIEHVEDDARFLAEMLRVARIGVCFSTPNYNVHKCKNKYHVREYTPIELRHLLRGLNAYYYTGDANRTITARAFVRDECMANDFGVWVIK
jgi:SAM-dependent methyltransferase